MPTAQEEFWAGDEGTAYTTRNAETLIDAKTDLFRRIWTRNSLRVRSLIEFGANRGLNIQAIQALGVLNACDIEFTAVEINRTACEELRRLPDVKVKQASALEFFAWEQPRELTLSMGFLIHQHPASLPHVYDVLYSASSKYILLAEYFSRHPVEVRYRDRAGLLWKRDFAAEMLERFPDLKLKDYGFVSRLDPVAPLDDLHWWLMQKVA